MRKIVFVFVLGAAALCGLYGCGPDQKELDRQKKIEDSLNALDSDNSLDEANKLLQQADSIEKAKQDSIALAAGAQAKK